MAIWMQFGDLFHCRVRQMVIMVVGNNNCVDERDVFDLARRLRVSFRSKPGERRAAVLKDRIEQHSQTVGKLDIVAGMAQPCRPQLRRLPVGQKFWCTDRNSRRRSVRPVGFPSYLATLQARRNGQIWSK